MCAYKSHSTSYVECWFGHICRHMFQCLHNIMATVSISCLEEYIMLNGKYRSSNGFSQKLLSKDCIPNLAMTHFAVDKLLLGINSAGISARFTFNLPLGWHLLKSESPLKFLLSRTVT